jgi:hypothetical protein
MATAQYRFFLLAIMLFYISSYADDLKFICHPTTIKQTACEDPCEHYAIDRENTCKPTKKEPSLCQNPCNSLRTSIEQGFIVQASYLFYQAMEDGLNYLQKLHISGGGDSKIFAEVEPDEPDFSWNSGVQVGIGYIFPQREQWELLLNWTYYQTHSENSVPSIASTNTADTLKPIWLPFLTGSVASQSSVHWLMHFNTIDLSLGRNFPIGQWLSMHPRAGLRGAWINQGYSSNYQAADLVNGGTIFPIGMTSFMGHWQYQAGGLRFGSDAEWLISEQFALIANLYGSVLYGRFTVEEMFDGAFAVSGAPPFLISEAVSFHKNYFRLRPSLETELGIRWQYFFSNHQRRAMIGAYYGLAYWFNQNALVNEFLSLDLTSGNSLISPLPATGDLQLHGLRVEGRFDF